MYLALAVVGHLPAFRSLTSTTRCACGDAPQTDWFLAWTPHAVLTGHTPWLTSSLDVPSGVNLTWNTVLPLPGLLMAPVTLTAGVLAAHTLLAVLAFAASATAMWWAVRRWAPWGPARFLAGLLYGFSPYMVSQGEGHLDLTLMALPPLVVVVLDELLVRQRRPAWQSGALLGLLAAAQLFTSEEVLATSFIAALIGLVVLAVQQRKALRAGRVAHAVLGLFTAVGVLSVLGAWPLTVQFGGPGRVSGPVQDSGRFAADLLGLVAPTVHQALGTAATAHWGGNDAENGSYLGPLLLLLAFLLVRFRKEPVLRFAAGVAVVCWSLSLGTHLHVLGVATAVPLPFAAISDLPLFADVTPERLSAYVDLFAALVVAVGLDRLHGQGVFRRGRPWALALAGVVCLAPLVPNWPYSYREAGVPAYFTGPQLQRIDPGAVVLTFPVPRFPGSAPMTWQAVSGFRYRSFGGYVITANAAGRGTFEGGKTAVERMFTSAAGGHHLPPLTAERTSTLLAALRAMRVDDIIVSTSARGAREVVRTLQAALGRAPDDVSGGVLVWYGLPQQELTPTSPPAPPLVQARRPPPRWAAHPW